MCMKVTSVATLILLLSFSAVHATDWTGAAGDGDWHNPANWSPIVPVAGEQVDIESLSNMTWPILNGGTVNCGQLRIAYEDGMIGELTVTGGAIVHVEGEMRIARKEPPKTSGILYISGADTEIHVTDRIECGRYGDGTIEMTSGYLQSDAELRMGFRDNSSTTVLLGGGTLDLGGNPGITVGAGADDVGSVSVRLDISGDGTLLMAGDQVTLVETLINDGIILAGGGEGTVLVTYDGLVTKAVATGLVTETASSPYPANEQTDVPRESVLGWTAGGYAPPVNAHTVYFSDNANDVNEGLGGIVQDASSFTPSESLEYGTTYYWRVDEVNSAPDFTVFKGEIWSFTVEPFSIPIGNVTATASGSFGVNGPGKTIDSSGLTPLDQHGTDAQDMWLSAQGAADVWIQYAFDRIYKLDEMWVWNSNQPIEAFIGFGAKDVTIETSTDGSTWTALEGIPPFAQANGQEDYEHNTAIAFNGVSAQHVRLTINSGHGSLPQYGLSEVRFFSIPTYATQPNPDSGATDVSTDVRLSWGKNGRDADQHKVYIGTEPTELTLTGSITENSFDTLPLDLQLAQTYYWRVDEVNSAEDHSVWEGDVWSFATADLIVTEDMESYSGDEGQEVFMTWFDGFGGDATLGGSTTGHIEGPFVETAIVKDGRQAMPMFYDNDGGFADIDGKVSSPTHSEVVRDFESAQDWRRAGVQGLVLNLYGNANNVPGQLYIKINNTKVSYNGDIDALKRPVWQKWYISLKDHLPDNTLANVDSLSIGIEGGGEGVVIIDAISLTGESRSLITPTEPSSDNLVAHYAFEGDASDSTGAHPGTVMGLSIFEPGKVGQAVSLAGVFGDYIEINGYKGIVGSSAITVMAWIKTEATESGTIIGWGSVAPDGGRFGFRVNDNRIRCEFTGGNVQGTAMLNDGNWHHVAVTVNAGATISYPAVTLWVDGQDDTLPSTDETTIAILADFDTRIGGRPTAEDRWFGGSIDELSLYNRVLSAEEIAGAAGRVASFDQ
jgi:hypothetical protein